MESLPEIAGAGGVFTALVVAFGYLLNFIIKRRSSERESESGIVETTRTTLELVREQRDLMVLDFEKRLKQKDKEIAALQEENERLKARLERLEAIVNANSNKTDKYMHDNMKEDG